MSDAWRELIRKRAHEFTMAGAVIIHPTPSGGVQLLTHPLHDAHTRQRHMMAAYAVLNWMGVPR